MSWRRSVEEAGGKVVKFMGDAGLLIYPIATAERAVVGLRRLQAVGDAWLADHDSPCRHIIKAHVGPVYCGQVGTRTEKHFDVFGETVKCRAVAISWAGDYALALSAIRAKYAQAV